MKLLGYPVFNLSGEAYPLPTRTEGSSQALHLESTLQELPLYRFQISGDRRGQELAQCFEQHPLLPGAVLTEQGHAYGMISRRRFLECLIRPHGQELFLREPLQVLYSYARSDILLLAGSTLILNAAQQALRRSTELLGEPILVQMDEQSYCLLDSHELNIAYWQIRGIETQVRYERAQAQMIQSDKMANLGRLVDGVAHEILDPVSFIWGNLSHVTAYSNALLEMLAEYEALVPNPPAAIAQQWEALEIDYLQADLPRTIASIQTGAERLSKLATSLQNFCHIDEVYPRPADLHELLDSIVLLLKSRLSSEIQIIKHYGNLPPVPCFAGQLNQVFMNILTNAVDTLINEAVTQQLSTSELARSPQSTRRPASLERPEIVITTQVRSGDGMPGTCDRWVAICIADNGPGLSAEAQEQITQSFLVEQRVAKETSLSISYQIITAKHGGRFEVRCRHPLPEELLEETHRPAASSNGATSKATSNGLSNGAIGPAMTHQNSASPASSPPVGTRAVCTRGTEFEILLPLT